MNVLLIKRDYPNYPALNNMNYHDVAHVDQAFGPDKLRKLNDDAVRNPDIADDIANNPEFLETWNHWDELGETEMRQRFQELTDMPASQRPKNPSEYLSQSYIDDWHSKFDDGIVRFTTQESIDEWGTIGGQAAFSIPKSEYDRVVAIAGDDFGKVEELLGLSPGTLTDGDPIIAWVKKEDLPDVTLPNGRETGANDLWVPGGITDHGVVEGIVDLTTNPPAYDRIFL